MKVSRIIYPGHFPLEKLAWQQVLAIGDFDGIHTGHQEVIGRALSSAQKLNLPTSIMTFDPHPREVLGQAKYRNILMPLQDKLDFFRDLGVAAAYIVSFNEAFSQMSPEDFVEGLLIPLSVKSVVVGFDFKFGYCGKGTADSLTQFSKGRFGIEVVRPFHQDGSKVSSTWVRDALQEGKVEEGNHLLGRPYSIKGKVVSGDGRGRTIGFPTANLAITAPYLIPSRGVYAIRIKIGEKWYNAVMNIGIKPTFHTGEIEQTLEAHVLDYNGDLYEQEVKVEFHHFIRHERKFASVDELVTQIKADVLWWREQGN